jgi:hypothetical protein
MVRFRDSHGRFSSRPRDSAGRYRSVEWFNRSQGQHARYQAAAEFRAAAEYSERRAREIAAEYEAAAERFSVPAGVSQHQRQDAWGLQVIGNVNVEPGAHVEVKIELGGKIVYEYDGRADEFAPMELREALDRWSVEYMGDEAHYWRRPELSLWEIDKTLDPVTLLATSVRARNLPNAEEMLRESMSTPVKESDNAVWPMSDAPADWPEDDDALPV